MAIFNSIVVLFLGLVIQLTQVQPCAMRESGIICPVISHSCCNDKISCPCADQESQVPKPAPSIPAAPDLKLNAPKARELDFSALLPPPASLEARQIAVSQETRPPGFSGVPLSVAFCSFVI